MMRGVDLCELIHYVLKFSAELSAWVVGWSSVEQKSYIRPCAVAPARELHPPLPPPTPTRGTGARASSSSHEKLSSSLPGTRLATLLLHHISLSLSAQAKLFTLGICLKLLNKVKCLCLSKN